MRLQLPFLLSALCFFPVSCQDDKKSAQKSKLRKEEKKEKSAEEKKKSLINVPAGAVMTDMVFPYYDEDLKKISLMTIRELTVSDDTVVDETLLSAKNVKLWLFDETGAIRSTTTISDADYSLEKEELRAKGGILMIGADNKFAAKSAGGIFSLATGQALLLGPATTRFEIPKKEPKKPQ